MSRQRRASSLPPIGNREERKSRLILPNLSVGAEEPSVSFDRTVRYQGVGAPETRLHDPRSESSDPNARYLYRSKLAPSLGAAQNRAESLHAQQEGFWSTVCDALGKCVPRWMRGLGLTRKRKQQKRSKKSQTRRR